MTTSPILALLCILSASNDRVGIDQFTGAQAGSSRWHHVTGRVRGQSEQLAADLESAHEILLARARTENLDLVKRLEPRPPRPLPRGYGVLPEIRTNAALRNTTPREWVYSLERLSTGFTSDFRGGAQLARRAKYEADLALEPTVVEFERLRASLRNIEQHLSYHEWWQGAIADDVEYFEGRNLIIAKARELASIQDDAEAAERIAVLRREIFDAVAPFKPADLHIVPGAEGDFRLRVTVQTDIRDDDFVLAFLEAVEQTWNGAEAMIERELRIELVLSTLPVEQVYPEGAPEHEARIDLEEHVARFPDDAMVLTTGADSTHAWRGRSILLGPVPVTRRTLAHEFGHLLGFSDAYLRGFDGKLGGEFGAVIVEWRGLLDDLMGNPAGGTVTREMVEQLFTAYGYE